MKRTKIPKTVWVADGMKVTGNLIEVRIDTSDIKESMNTRGLEQPIKEALGQRQDTCLDHCRLTNDTNGNAMIVSHPYWLNSKDILALAELIKHGYHVDINGQSTYYPGSTVKVEYRRPAPNGLKTDPDYVPQVLTDR